MNFYQSFYENTVFVEDLSIDHIIGTINQNLRKEIPMPQFIPIENASLPTFVELNQVTITPYLILTAYGIPHYQEINPIYFNLITFPFFFGIMFGDIGHGSILFSFGLSLIFFEKRYK